MSEGSEKKFSIVRVFIITLVVILLSIGLFAAYLYLPVAAFRKCKCEYRICGSGEKPTCWIEYISLYSHNSITKDPPIPLP